MLCKYFRVYRPLKIEINEDNDFINDLMKYDLHLLLAENDKTSLD